MKRSIISWIVFAACLALLFFAMARVSVSVIKLERADVAARRQAVLEENARLALWRMESEVAYIVARESVRPFYHYFAPGDGNVVVNPLVPDEDIPFVKLFFQVDAKGNVATPRPDGPVSELRRIVSRSSLESVLAGDVPDEPATEPQRQTKIAQTAQVAQVARNDAEFQMRNQFSRRAVDDNNPGNVNFAETSEITSFLNAYNGLTADALPFPGESGTAVMTPAWIEGALFLLRRVEVNGSSLIQGCWLDWDGIRDWLRGEIADLLPNATLEPMAAGTAAGSEFHCLASLPVRLLPGSFENYPVPGSTTMNLTLAAGWACFLLAAGAVAVLLVGTLRLSERRGAFVSAVTHELRTPLTTMQMYTEMLADGMVTDESKRQRYLKTIHAESDRLGHLVENVLAYARIEKNTPRRKVEALSLGDLIARVRGRLDQRVAQAGRVLDVDVGGDRGAFRVRADASAVEQILFNLVDNACKYGGGGEDGTIRVVAGVDAGGGTIAVSDSGAGVGEEVVKKLFRPFSKSARDAAGSAPGVGLGLALSRRLSRLMGGDLTLDRRVGRGARFVLSLPAC